MPTRTRKATSTAPATPAKKTAAKKPARPRKTTAAKKTMTGLTLVKPETAPTAEDRSTIVDLRHPPTVRRRLFVGPIIVVQHPGEPSRERPFGAECVRWFVLQSLHVAAADLQRVVGFWVRVRPLEAYPLGGVGGVVVQYAPYVDLVAHLK